MKKIVRLLICTGCCLLLILSWIIVINSKSTAEKQQILINKATELISDGIYIRAAPLLEEAAGYDAVHTIDAENILKKVYLSLMDKRGYPRKYTTLLEKQMDRRDAEPYMFIEAANYYLSLSKTQDALKVLKHGIDRTGDTGIAALYEESRYIFEMNRTSYEHVTAIFEQTVQVLHDGRWGTANAEGIIILPCDYDKISTLSNDRAIVKKEGRIYAVDKENNRIAVTNENISAFGNFAENRIPVFINNSWRRMTGEFELGTSEFEDIGMYSGGYVAAKTKGKWGVVDISDNWLIPAEFDEIIQDELGRCYAQGSVFVRDGMYVYLFTDGDFVGGIYEDARPFSDEAYAAVKKNGKWGFIDTAGTVMIPFIFEDALSFGQHLAAVKYGELWGYIGLYGHVVIDPVFYEAKSFSGGSAPVLTDRGWQFITLLEFKKGYF